MQNIPLFLPYIDDEDIKSVIDVLKSKSLSRGPRVEEFENLFAKVANRKFAVAVNSGTSGLDICLKALGLGKNDEVITSVYSFIASANCILYQNAKPKLCDINKDSFLMDDKFIEKLITKNTKAILPVDIFGQAYNLNKLKKFDLPIIVDSCESFGIIPQDLALANVYGFYPNKQITTGEGGIIVTNDESFAKKLKSLRNQGFISDPDYLNKIELGFNFRLSDINASLGISQLKKSSDILTKRFNILSKYNTKLSNLPGINTVLSSNNIKVSPFNYMIVLESQNLRNNIAKALSDSGIEYSYGFIPLNLFAHIQKSTGYKSGDFPIAEDLSSRTLCLPFFTELSDVQIEKIVSVIKQGIVSCKR